jgi:hypothetical protein
MSAPQGFDPTASLLPANPSAHIVPFQGGGALLQPFYQKILAMLSEDKRKGLPTEAQILKFTTSVKDGNFVLTLRVKGKQEDEEEGEEGVGNPEIREEPVEDTPAEDLKDPLERITRQHQNISESYDLPVEQEPNPEQNAIGLREVSRANNVLQKAKSLLSASSAVRTAELGRGVNESKSRSPSPENTRREGVPLTEKELERDPSTIRRRVLASPLNNATPLNQKSRLQLQQSFNNGRVAFGALKTSQKPQRRPLSD